MSPIIEIREGQCLVNASALARAMRANRPNRSDTDDAADVIDELLKQRDELLTALVGMVQEPQPLGIDRESYQTAIALVIKHHDDVDNPEAWAARRTAA